MVETIVVSNTGAAAQGSECVNVRMATAPPRLTCPHQSTTRYGFIVYIYNRESTIRAEAQEKRYPDWKALEDGAAEGQS